MYCPASIGTGVRGTLNRHSAVYQWCAAYSKYDTPDDRKYVGYASQPEHASTPGKSPRWWPTPLYWEYAQRVRATQTVPDVVVRLLEDLALTNTGSKLDPTIQKQQMETLDARWNYETVHGSVITALRPRNNVAWSFSQRFFMPLTRVFSQAFLHRPHDEFLWLEEFE